MSNKKTIHLLIDTSCLWKAGPEFSNPDFRKLLQFSKDGLPRKDGLLRIFIPHIVWEERRTQLIENLYGKVRHLSESFKGITAEFGGSNFVQGLSPPTLSIWSKTEIDAKSKEWMANFAAENGIEIIPLANDHAERSWQRYFNVDPPFNPAVVEREKRRKDIPDAWIFEAAIDVQRMHPDLSALCGDGALSNAMQTQGIRIFKEARQVLDEIEKILDTKPVAKAEKTNDAAPMMVATENKLD
ncbi:MAG: PIN domain-containing protein, partial [Gallionella sp.]